MESTRDDAGRRADTGSARAAAEVDFLLTIGRLKTTKRTGWVRRGIPLPESIADHSFRAAVAALLLVGTPGVDAARACVVALAHDLAEAVVGDLTPDDPVTPEDKHARETAGMRAMTAGLDAAGSTAGALLRAAFDEYEAGATAEARCVKAIDKVEMGLQALEYEAAHPALDLSAFFAAGAATREPAVRAWAADVARRRTPRAAAPADGGGVDGPPAAGATAPPWRVFAAGAAAGAALTAAACAAVLLVHARAAR